MKTTREWLEELPEPYRTQALENCKWLNENCNSLDSAICGAFPWDETSQSDIYWAEVADWCANPQENDLPPPWVAPTPTRPEALRDRIATIIQSGYINKRTSDEVAGEVMELVGRDSTPAG
jgi:hypothetical protein